MANEKPKPTPPSAAKRRRVPTRAYRIASQIAMFSLWVTLIWMTQHPIDHWLTRYIPVSVFLRGDPLVSTVVMGGMRVGVNILMLGFITLAVSTLLGRVFCGWICPLGSIFDFYSWVIQKFKVHHFGPSPWYFRAKFYILAAILVFAALGSFSPLIGLDPIVLLTRVAASVVQPFGRAHSGLTWNAGDTPLYFGNFINFSSLLLFAIIMGYTTRVSRIWCRTACPLGAYLGAFSRYSVLRRETKNCIQCNICSQNCPTGAIDFKNNQIYNESECIKCFVCSNECPVDANFFTVVKPFPANKPSGDTVDLNKRALLATVTASAIAAPLMRIEAGTPANSKTLIRPPMSREESDFLSSCIRCGECMKACPTGTLKPAGLQHGIRAVWTPVLTPLAAPCQEGCNACSVACPTDAILKYPVEKKYDFKAGTAVFNSSNCISYTEKKFCSECVRVCPTNAIEFSLGWEPKPEPKHEWGVAMQGSEQVAPEGLIPTRPLKVNFDSCVGCGACEQSCHQIVYGDTAMKTTSAGRATPTHLTDKNKKKAA